MGNIAYVQKRDITKLKFRNNAEPLFIRMDIELTERCNNNCIHCYINLPKGDTAVKKKELSTEELKNILKEAVSLGCLRVKFTGGEPLLRNDFEEIYIFARRLGLGVAIFTNATLITPHLAGLLKRTPALEKMEVSIYGMKKESYEAVTRTVGSFEAAWQGINLLLEYKIPFEVRSAVLPSNEEEIDEFETWAATIPWMTRPPSYAMFFNLRPRRDDEAKNRLIQTLRLNAGKGLKFLTRRKKEYIKEMKQFCSKSTQPHGDKLFSCNAGCGNCCLDAYGVLQLCITLRHPDCVYDLRNGSLKDALTNFFPKIREKKAVNPQYLNRCARCFLKDLCGQCPAMSWMEYGALDTPVEYLCEIASIQARFLGLLREGGKAWQANR